MMIRLMIILSFIAFLIILISKPWVIVAGIALIIGVFHFPYHEFEKPFHYESKYWHKKE